MTDLKTLNAAVTATVKEALERAGMRCPMLAKEVYENIPRPSAKIIFGDTRITETGPGNFERTCEIIAVWNAPDIYEFKLDCLAAQDAVEPYLLSEGIVLPDGDMLEVTEVRSVIGDAAVLMRFSVTDYGFIVPGEGDEGGDSGELMGILNLNYESEDE